MNYNLADVHPGHKAVLGFDNRPIENWNSRVRDELEPFIIVMTNKNTGTSFRVDLNELDRISLNSDNVIFETESGINIGVGEKGGIVINPSYAIRCMKPEDENLPMLRVVRRRE